MHEFLPGPLAYWPLWRSPPGRRWQPAPKPTVAVGAVAATEEAVAVGSTSPAAVALTSAEAVALTSAEVAARTSVVVATASRAAPPEASVEPLPTRTSRRVPAGQPSIAAILSITRPPGTTSTVAMPA